MYKRQINITSASGAHGNAAISIDTGGTSADGDTLNLNGDVTTAGAQTYDSAAVVLGGDAVLTSSASGNITFLDAPIDGAQALTINTSGTAQLNSTIGDTTPLTSLTTDSGGITSIATGVISTTGAQTFNDAVTLESSGTPVLTSSGGIVSFQTTVDGDADLTVNANGATTFAGAVGGSTALTSLATDAAGTTSLGGNVTTTAAQTYNDAVTVAASLTVQGTEVDINSTVALGANALGICLLYTSPSPRD